MYQLVEDLRTAGVEPSRLWWLRLDHPFLMEESLEVWLETLTGFARQKLERDLTDDYPLFVFLDEIPYANDWAAWLKTFYDDRWPVRIVATGSATAAMRQEHRESGVGRWREWYLSPLQLHDFLGIQGVSVSSDEDTSAVFSNWRSARCGLNDSELVPALQQFVMVGGFPELAANAGTAPDAGKIMRSQEVLREDAINRSIYKDLTQAYDIRQPLALEKLLYILADQIGGVLSIDSLAQSTGVKAPTVETYLKYLEEAGLILILRNFAASEEAIQRRGRKVYFTDSALRNAALQRGMMPLENPAELGVLYENAVASSLFAYARANQQPLFHWRDKKQEVDFVAGVPSTPTAFEVTAGDKHSVASLRAILSRYAEFKGRGWLLAPSVAPRDPSTHDGAHMPGKAPLAQWLLVCGLATDASILRHGKLDAGSSAS